MPRSLGFILYSSFPYFPYQTFLASFGTFSKIKNSDGRRIYGVDCAIYLDRARRNAAHNRACPLSARKCTRAPIVHTLHNSKLCMLTAMHTRLVTTPKFEQCQKRNEARLTTLEARKLAPL